MLKQLFTLLCFEIKLAFLDNEGIWGGLLYFLLTIIIMPFTLNIASYDLSQIATTMIWIAIIPTILISSSRLFLNDIEDGFIDRYLLMNISFEAIFLIKIVVLFISVTVPLLCVMPIIGFLFSVPFNILIKIYCGLLASLPAIIFFTGFGSLLSLQGRMSYLINFTIVIPLIIPSIILGAGVVYTTESLIVAMKLPIIFSLFSILITVPASGFLYQQLYHDQ